MLTSMRTVRVAVALTMMMMTTVAACTPADEPMVGLSVVGGKPTTVFVSCSRSIAVARVHENGPAPPPGAWAADGGELLRWSVSTSSASTVTELELFAPPPTGWEIDDATLAVLKPDRRYSISGMGGRHAISTGFTTADLAGLDDNHVVMGPIGQGRWIAERKAFERYVPDGCG
jgi:hypothetical protein